MKGNLFALVFVLAAGVGLLLLAGVTKGQETATPGGATDTPTATPAGSAIDPATLVDLFGEPALVVDDPTSDLFNCQDSSVRVTDSPSDLMRLEVYAVPDDWMLMDGWFVAAYTAAPFQQIMDESYSGAAAALGRTADGGAEGRLYEVHDEQFRVGAINTQFELIEGTGDLAAVSPDGAAAVFNIPAAVTDFRIQTFHMGIEGESTVCDVLPNDGTILLPAAPVSWLAALSDENRVATLTDPAADVVICGVGGAASAPAADILSVEIYRPPADSPYPNGWIALIITEQSSSEVEGDVSRYTAMLNSFLTDGASQRWTYDVVEGRQVSYVLDANNAPVEGLANFAVLDENRSAIAINIPNNVTYFQAQTALATTANESSVCDVAPDLENYALPTAEEVVPVGSPTPPDLTVCEDVRDQVPEAVIEQARAARPSDDPTRTHLVLRNPNLPYHPIYNPLVWGEACP